MNDIQSKPTSPPASDLWQQANEHHQAAERAALTAIERARQCGDVLIKLKATCKHGEWRFQLKEHFSGSARTAQAFMQLSKRWPELAAKSATAADLTLRDALKALAGPAAVSPASQQEIEADLFDKRAEALDEEERLLDEIPNSRIEDIGDLTGLSQNETFTQLEGVAARIRGIDSISKRRTVLIEDHLAAMDRILIKHGVDPDVKWQLIDEAGNSDHEQNGGN